MSKDVPPRILHLHSTFAAGGKELRSVRLINAFGTRVHHAIVSAEPEETGAAQHIAHGSRVTYPKDFPALKGKPLPGRLPYVEARRTLLARADVRAAVEAVGRLEPPGIHAGVGID